MHPPSSCRSCDTVIWWLIAAMAASGLVAGAGLGFRIDMPRSLIAVAGVAALFGAMAIGQSRTKPRLTIGARAFLQMTMFTLVGVVLSYVLAARGGVLWDERLRAMDRALGLDWPRLFDAADRLGHWLWLGGLAYHSLTVQMVVCIVLLSATHQAARLRVAVTAAVASGFATNLISGAMPALGNVFDPADYRYLWPSVAWMEQAMLAGLRDGSWRVIDLTQPMGIVTFPSYHATLPIILTWAIWRTPRWRVLSALWSIELRSLAYAERLDVVRARGIGIWDVYAHCRREGSLDADIEAPERNDFSTLRTQAPGLVAVAHNGGESARVMHHLRSLGFAVHRLPSTSPANAGWSFERKLAAWREVFALYDLA